MVLVVFLAIKFDIFVLFPVLHFHRSKPFALQYSNQEPRKHINEIYKQTNVFSDSISANTKILKSGLTQKMQAST